VITDRLPAFGVPPSTSPRGRRGMVARALARPSLPALGTLLIMVVVFGLNAPELLTVGGLAGVLDVSAVLGIGGVAVALLLISGQFDLSVGVVGVAGALVAALLIAEAGWPAWPAVLVSLVCALLVGLVNGLLVVNLGLPSFLVTLATFLVLQGTTVGLTDVVAGTTTIGGLDEAPGWTSVSAVFDGTLQVDDARFRVSLLWWLGATALASWVLWRTRFGNAVLAAGGARRAARELGVAVRRTTVALFCLSATAGWLIGMLSLARLGGVQVAPVLGSEIEFIVVAVIGGCLLTGGYGSAFGSAVGALIYGVAWQGIPLAGWDQRWFRALLGVLLLLALVVNGVVHRRLQAVPRS
jgi:simple sugar transport system permease protein